MASGSLGGGVQGEAIRRGVCVLESDSGSGLSLPRFGIPPESPTSSVTLDVLGFLSLGLLIPKMG